MLEPEVKNLSFIQNKVKKTISSACPVVYYYATATSCLLAGAT
jgi:hypothetical protein